MVDTVKINKSETLRCDFRLVWPVNRGKETTLTDINSL